MRDLTQPLKLIDILADGQFHSGEELGHLFGISRAAINKHIKTLRSWGINLESVQSKGYRLDRPMLLLKTERITAYEPALDTADFTLLPVIDSTNQYLLDRVTQLRPGAVCLAEYQQAGRGRRGRQWFSPFGANLYLSLYWRFAQGPAAAVGLSLAVGIVVADILRQVSGKPVRVKWPNDLYLDDRKLAGILVELVGRTGDDAHVVVGMGINLAMQNPDEHVVNQQWSNLGDIDRNELAAQLIVGLRQALERFEKSGLSGFIEQWNVFDNFLNRHVKLLIGDHVIRGIARGINSQGALLLEQDGVIKPYVGGEISLRADNLT